MKRTKINRKDWRNLPPDQWNTVTVHAMVIDLNREYFGVDTYVPWRNWSAERGIIKRNLTLYGADVIREVIERAFDEYRPTPQYPQLTAGFVFAYMASRILPRVLANRQRRQADETAEGTAPDAGDVKAWL